MAASSAFVVTGGVVPTFAAKPESVLVNDIHSQLNPTRVTEVLEPHTLKDVQAIIGQARKGRKAISIAGGRHAMGGQQFGADTSLIDVRKLNRILDLDHKTGVLEVEGGIEWPELIDGYLALQQNGVPAWGIAQKQTGADRFRISGTIASRCTRPRAYDDAVCE